VSREQFLGILRHLLGAAGGILLAGGMADATLITEATGALMAVAAVTWSLLAKR
jgi:hypothetical protein